MTCNLRIRLGKYNIDGREWKGRFLLAASRFQLDIDVMCSRWGWAVGHASEKEQAVQLSAKKKMSQLSRIVVAGFNPGCHKLLFGELGGNRTLFGPIL